MKLVVVQEDVAVDLGAYDEPVDLDRDGDYSLDLNKAHGPLFSEKVLLVFAFALAGFVMLLLGASMTKGSVEGQLIRAIRHAFGGP